jgi:hypothetical protein
MMKRMTGDRTIAPPGCGAEQVGRWAQVLDHLQAAVSRSRSVVVDGNDGLTGWVADRLAERILGAGRGCERLTQSALRVEEGIPVGAALNDSVTVADGPGWRQRPDGAGWDVVIRLRTPPFHPSGRATLAARHGRVLRPDEPLAEAPLRSLAGNTGLERARI